MLTNKPRGSGFAPGRVLLLGCLLLLGGCESLAYYGQAASGHAGIMLKRTPIQTLLESDDLDPALRAQLEKVVAIRRFAADRLSLPATDQYRSYVQLDHEYAVWNVVAAPALSLAPKTWCYPVVGCAAYRGYYRQERARRYGEKLRRQGYDVYVGGVTAYSTLGWFSDPVLSSFVHLPDAELANLLFHELAHQVLYADDDTVFNESFATVVAQEGVRRWLKERDAADALPDYRSAWRRQQQFVALVADYRRRLRALYQSAAPKAEKLADKQAILEELRQAYEEISAQHDGAHGYEGWFAGELNNARLNLVATYYELVPQFEALLEQHRGDLAEFYADCERLSETSSAERRAYLAQCCAADAADEEN